MFAKKQESRKLSPESKNDSSDVDDPSDNDKLRIVTSSEEEKEKKREGNEKEEEETDENEDEEEEEENDDDDDPGMVETDELNIKNSESFNANFFLEELTPDDEILTFQCPENFDVGSLLNKTLNLSKITQIKEGGSTFSCQFLGSNKKTLTFIFPSKNKNAGFAKLHLGGHIVIRKSLELPENVINSAVEDEHESSEIIMRDSITRHPLLGRDWNKHLHKVRKQIKKHKKLLKKSLQHKESLVKAEKERKEQKKKLKVQLALLKKKTLGM